MPSTDRALSTSSFSRKTTVWSVMSLERSSSLNCVKLDVREASVQSAASLYDCGHENNDESMSAR